MNVEKFDPIGSKHEEIESLFEKELKEQYESQREILESVGILENLSKGEMGIKGIDGKEYPFPMYQEIVKRMRENKDVLKTKTEQGFNKLLVVPFGMKLDDLIEKYKEVILKHHKEEKLLATKENTTDPNEPLELDESEPLWAWDKYKDADIEGKLVYFPEEFSQDHKGKTKEKVLNEKGAWNILLIEDLPNIPRKDKGKIIKDRKQLEAGKTPNEYLKTLKESSEYQNETGMTPEEQIICAINHLERTNEVIEDCQGEGSLSYQLGAYFSVGGDVPRAYWLRVNRRAGLGGSAPSSFSPDSGVRTAVRV